MAPPLYFFSSVSVMLWCSSSFGASEVCKTCSSTRDYIPFQTASFTPCMDDNRPSSPVSMVVQSSDIPLHNCVGEASNGVQSAKSNDSHSTSSQLRTWRG
ncbi:uncharacterized protein EI90DRAFT_3085620 [Cantharellus anzutake]|uniref:uncharacterized protein n=1 Tax=Cantharellus anzutake TaxID=1750568 RepID=UPI001902E4EF|nr:uncharacterized protein EI90DRAFT_3085620 [Cantharellus anzutake]KAF8316997.1 hypothetical protein EI90DRAFT_3085620 [Cantharellus anzutake]